MLHDQSLDATKFCRGEAEIESERNGLEPELRGLIIAVNVNMGRFVRLVAIEIHTIRLCHQYGRHSDQYLIATHGYIESIVVGADAAGSGRCRLLYGRGSEMLVPEARVIKRGSDCES